MNSRRSFFRRLAVVAATVALAPELAFGRLRVTEQTLRPARLEFWMQVSRVSKYESDLYKKYAAMIFKEQAK